MSGATQYRSEFPHDARARVEAQRIRAYEAFEQEVRGIESWLRDVPFVRCVMRIFIAFAREACEFSKKSNHRAWSDRELDQRCRDFLMATVVDAWEDKGEDLSVEKIFSSGVWGYSLHDAHRGKIEKSPEWKQYQELLLEAFQAQGDRAADCSLPQPERATGTAPKAGAALSAEPATMSNGNNDKSTAEILPDEKVRRRSPKDFIDAGRGRPKRSYEQLAARIGISKDTLYAITKETRWVSDENYKIVAEVCGCNPEDLHPRDVPRPERRRR